MNIDAWFSHLTRKMLGGLFLYNPTYGMKYECKKYECYFYNLKYKLIWVKSFYDFWCKLI